MKISRYFTFHEALFLPQWGRIAETNDGLTEEVLNNLKRLFNKLDAIRDHFNLPIHIHCAYRPPAYNALVGGAKGSSHQSGLAADFHVEGLNCDDVRASILKSDLLNTLELRMEDLPGSTWAHIDLRAPGARGRFFRP